MGTYFWGTYILNFTRGVITHQEDRGDEGTRVDAGRRLVGVLNHRYQGPVDILER